MTVLKSQKLSQMGRWIGISLVYAMASYYVLAFAILACYRVPFPFDLEWLEGGMVDQMRRIVEGLPIYVEPSLDFIPFPYTPLYFFFGAALTPIAGIGPMALRLVSALSTAVILFLIARIVQKETGHWRFGLITAGLFAATCSLNAYWFDLARVDMLDTAFILGAFYLLRYKVTLTGYLVAALFVVLAFWTKQSALCMGLALAVCACLMNWRLGLVFTGSMLTAIAVSFLIGEAVTDGWLSYYTITLLSGHGILKGRLLKFWTGDILKPLGLLVSATIAGFVSMGYKKAWRDLFFFGVFFVANVVASYLMRLKVGGANNCLIPTHLVLAIMSGLAMKGLGDVELFRESRLRGAFAAALFSIFAIYLASLICTPVHFFPTKEAYREGQKVVDIIKKTPGDVWLVNAGNMTEMAGKQMTAHGYQIADLLRHQTENPVNMRRIRRSLAARKFELVIVNSKKIPDFARQLMDRKYEKTNEVLRLLKWQSPEGWKYSTQNVYRHKKEEKAAPEVSQATANQ